MSDGARNPYRALVDASVDGLLVVDEQGRVRFANPGACRLLRKPLDELLGFPLGVPVGAGEGVELQIAGGQGAPSGDPSTTVVELRAADIEWEGVAARLMSLRDVTAQRRAEQRIAASEARFRALFDNSIDAIVVADEDGRYTHVNQAACELMGYTREQLMGMRVADLITADGRDAGRDYARYVEVGEQQGRFAFVRPDGEERLAEYSAFELGPGQFVSILRDITARTALEQRSLHAHRLESMGRLAGGVAHDFNNLLTVILMFAEFVRERLGDDEEALQDLRVVIESALRGQGLTRQLLAFSRKQTVSPVLLDLNERVRELETMLRRTVGEHIEFRVRLDPAAGCVCIDPTALEQVVVNLAVNARDAMPSGGTLTIETSVVHVEGARISGAGDPVEMVPGTYACLTVTDTGIGMDALTQARVFEPFFTTKQVGEGTGLGLATCYGIVKQADGYIWVSSAPGQGTKFEIQFPRRDGEADVLPLEPGSSDASGRETILLVEDDPYVLHAAMQVLENLGYDVLAAVNGKHALAAYAHYEGPIHLLLTDLVMPRMSGRELARQLSATRPGLKVLYMSGYTDDAAVDPHGHDCERELEPGVALLTKPFSTKTLAARVREILDASSRERRAQ